MFLHNGRPKTTGGLVWEGLTAGPGTGLAVERTYLLSDFGGNWNSPQEMVSTAFKAMRTTCWH